MNISIATFLVSAILVLLFWTAISKRLGWTSVCNALITQAFFVVVASMALTRLRHFSFENVAKACLFLSILVWGTLALRIGWVSVFQPLKAKILPRLFGAVLLFFTATNLAFPTYFLTGGRDYALYLIYGIQIAKTGELNLDQPVLREAVAKFPDAIGQEYPGIYDATRFGETNDPAAHLPQFLPLFGAVSANLAEFWGVEGVVRANSAIATIGILAFIAVGTIFFSESVTFLAAIALMLNAAFIFNARITSSEMLAFFLTFSGAGFLLSAFNSKNRAFGNAIVGGILLGMNQFNRLDGFFGLLLYAALFIAVPISNPNRRAMIWVSFVSYLIVEFLGFYDGITYHFPYLEDHFRGGLLILSTIFLAITLAAAVLSEIARKNHAYFEILFRVRDKVNLWFSTFVTIYFLLFFVVIQNLGIRMNETSSVGEIGWYVTPLLVATFPVGVWQLLRGNKTNAFLLIAGLMPSALFFIVFPSVVPDHYWATRRWVSHVFPFVTLVSIFGMVWVLGSLTSKTRRIFASFGITFYLANSLVFASFFFPMSIFKNFKTAYENFAHSYRQIESTPEGKSKEKFILTRDTSILTPLSYVFDIPVLLLGRNPGAKKLQIANKLEGIRMVGADPFQYGIKPDINTSVCSDYIAERKFKRPLLKSRPCINLSSFIIPSTWDRPWSIDWPSDAAPMKTNPEQSKISSISGPNSTLFPGKYRLQWFGEIAADASQSVRFRVVSQNGASLHDSYVRDREIAGEVAHIEFVLNELTEGVEFLIDPSSTDVVGHIDRLSLSRESI